jgi:hypothetical protein
MLDTLGYKHTLRKCKIYYCPTTTMVKRTRLNVTFIRTLRAFFLSALVAT